MATYRRPLPSVEELVSNFYYLDGGLYWRDDHPCQKVRGNKAGYVNSKGYYTIRVNGVLYLEHRLIYKMFKETEPDYIDHIDRCPSNNRIDNLRECTQRENLMNSPNYGYKGHQLPSGNWRVRLRYKMKCYHVGCYATSEIAEQVYNLLQKEVNKCDKELTHDEVKDIITKLKQTTLKEIQNAYD